MNKTAIKNFAVRARRQLIEEISQKAYEAGIEKDRIHEIVDFAGGFRVKGRENGRVFKDFEKSQRKKLIEKLNEKGYEQLIEEVAYTWFNRFIAIRFMEVNDYLPAKTRVLSSEEKEKIEPDILPNALQINLDVENEEKHQKKIFELEEAGDREDLYKYLLVKQCNQLGKIMPQVFEQIGDYTELLLPDKLLAEGSVIRDLVTSIEEYDWMIELSDGKEPEENNGEHGIEIIGWLYQYYISEKKDEVFAGLKKNQKITKENIPAATQLFTPKWIVKYMVENSLGRLWLESHPDKELQESFKYYLEEAEQEPEVQKQLDELKNPNLDPETITVLDPAMGSGHILVYAFDVLYDIYQKQGYNERDIPKIIIERNLYGLDIDDRAGQLASFAILMKGRSKNRRFFRDQVKLNLCAIQESNGIPSEAIEYLVSPKNTELEKQIRKEDIEYLVSVFKDAKEYGSILEVKPIDFDAIERRMGELKSETPTDFYELRYRDLLIEKVEPLLKQGKIMSEKYDVVCTNPPYMGSDSMYPTLKKYVNEFFSEERYDLYTVFITIAHRFVTNKGLVSMITQHSFMYAYSFEEFRKKLINSHSILNLLHLGSRAFEEISGEVVQTIAFTTRKRLINIISKGVRLVEYKKDKENAFFKEIENYYLFRTKNILKMPQSIFAYSISDTLANVFENNNKIGDYFIAKAGVVTGNDKYFIRYWYEVKSNEISIKPNNEKVKYSLFSKGGTFTKWHINNQYVIKLNDLWNDNIVNKSVRRGDKNFYFKKGIGWSYMGGGNSKSFGVIENCVCGTGTPSIYTRNDKLFIYCLGLLNTKIPTLMFELFNPTLNTYSSDVMNIPLIIDNEKEFEVQILVGNSLETAKEYNDLQELSINFKADKLIYNKKDSKLSKAYQNWNIRAKNNYNNMMKYMQRLNEIFIKMYNLGEELNSEVEDKHITIGKADFKSDIKSFISYAVGCSFGRYSLDEEGLQYAGGDFADHFREEEEKWLINTEEGWKASSMSITESNVIPIIEGDYFEEDLLERVVQFVKVSFGEEALDENLEFIADALGKKKTETPREAIRRYLLKDFYKDHVRIYKKRPIYWQFESGKQGAFKALIYMHRYDPHLVARLRTEYLHPLQKKYEAEVYQIDDLMSNEETSKSEIGKLRKQKEVLLKKIDELKVYDQTIGHVANQKIDIDLDDGVKVNYEKFQGVEIPQGEGKKPLKENLLTKI